MKSFRRILGVILLATIVGLAGYLYLGSSTPAGQPPLTRLISSNFSDLPKAFNAAKDSVRIVTLLSPT